MPAQNPRIVELADRIVALQQVEAADASHRDQLAHAVQSLREQLRDLGWASWNKDDPRD